MPINANITDSATKLKAEIINNGDKNSLVVATHPLKEYANVLRFFTNDDYGVDMNQNAGSGGTPEIVHDGTDLTKWTATDIIGGGKTTFNNGDHAYEGIITVADNAGIAGESYTINTTTRTEGAGWSVAGTAALTAAAIATDINTNVTGFSATSVFEVVTVTSDNGYDIAIFTTSDATDLPGTGLSIKVVNSPVDDVFQLDKGSDLDCTGYVSISMWIYVDKDWKGGDIIELYGWDTGLGIQIGNAVDLSDYFTFDQFDIWHKLIIPLSSFGDVATSTTLDALRVRISAAEGKSPKFYIDVLQFEQTGTPIEYVLKPDIGTWLHVNSFQILLADEYAGTLADSSMASIPYDSFFGVTKLPVGIIYKRVTNGETISSANIQQFLDFMAFSNAAITGSGSDGTNSWVTVNMQFTEPVILKSEDEDVMGLTVNDDLTGLLVLRVGAGSKVEDGR